MSKIAYTVGGHLATLYNHTTAVGVNGNDTYNGVFRLYKYSNNTDTLDKNLKLDATWYRNAGVVHTTSFDMTHSVIQNSIGKSVAIGNFSPVTPIQDGSAHKGSVELAEPTDNKDTYFYVWFPNTELNNSPSAFSASMSYNASGHEEYALDVLKFDAPTAWSVNHGSTPTPYVDISYTNIGTLQNINTQKYGGIIIGGTQVEQTDAGGKIHDTTYNDISAQNVTANVTAYAVCSGSINPTANKSVFCAEWNTFNNIDNCDLNITLLTKYGSWTREPGDNNGIHAKSITNSNITAEALWCNSAVNSNFCMGNNHGDYKCLYFLGGVVDNCTFSSDIDGSRVMFSGCTVSNVSALGTVTFEYR